MFACDFFRNNKNLMEITSKPFERPLSQKSEPPSFYTDFHLDLMAKLSQNGKLPAPNINKSSLKKMLNMHFHKQKPSSNSTHTIRIWRKTHTRLHKYTQPITQFTHATLTANHFSGARLRRFGCGSKVDAARATAWDKGNWRA